MVGRKDIPQLGAGLIGIGRKWGYKEPQIVPSETEARDYLQTAYRSGIRFFDTAPSYGSSEERLGKFLGTLSRRQRREVTVATKFGEHWNSDTQSPYTDHTYLALEASIKQSITRLGVPDVLILHKADVSVMQSDDLQKAAQFAREQGIKQFGISVSDEGKAAELLQLLEDDAGREQRRFADFTYVQLPFNNTDHANFAGIIERAHTLRLHIVTNRPFNMGKTIEEPTGAQDPKVEAFTFVQQRLSSGDVVLTGTKSPDNLRANETAFRRALRLRR